MNVKKEGILKTSFYKRALRWWLLAAIGYFSGLATLPFGARPFGFAILCSTRVCALPALAGVMLSCIGDPRATLYIAAYLAVFITRIALSAMIKGKKSHVGASFSDLFDEPAALCSLNAAVFSFLFSLYYTVIGNFLLYDVYALIINTSVSAIASLAWKRYVREAESADAPLIKRATDTGGMDIICLLGFISLSATVVLGAKGIELIGVSVPVFIAMTITLFATRRGSLSQGALVGALCGVAVDTMLAPSFAFAALLFGLLSPISSFLGALSAFVASLWWGFYSLGISALTTLLPAVLAASILFVALDGMLAQRTEQSLSEKDEKKQDPTSIKTVLASEMVDINLGRAKKSLRRLGSGLSALSDELLAIGSEHRPEEKDIYDVCESAFDSVCSSCAEREICRTDCEFSEEIGIIGGELRRGESAKSSSVSDRLRQRCTRLPDIIDEINYTAALCRSIEREREQSEFFASDYKALSALAASCEAVIDPSRPTSTSHVKLAQRISDQLDGAEVAVMDKDRLTVIISLADDAVTDEKILSALKSACKENFYISDSRKKNGIRTLVCSPKPRLKISFDAKSACAVGESDFCGDTYGVARAEDDSRFIAFINDGMGCGRDAFEVSRAAAAFLKNLLPLSADCKPVIDLLNSYLRRRGSDNLRESSVSVDLVDVDLVRSRAVFCKSGAAPTYVLRDGSVFKIRARTIPIGIISEVDIKRVELDIREKDIIVMVSDGVTQGKEECPRLFELLCGNRSADPRRISELVMKYATEEGGKDDISVLVLRADPV